MYQHLLIKAETGAATCYQDPRDKVYGEHMVGLDMLDFLREFLQGQYITLFAEIAEMPQLAGFTAAPSCMRLLLHNPSDKRACGMAAARPEVKGRDFYVTGACWSEWPCQLLICAMWCYLESIM